MSQELPTDLSRRSHHQVGRSYGGNRLRSRVRSLREVRWRSRQFGRARWNNGLRRFHSAKQPLYSESRNQNVPSYSQVITHPRVRFSGRNSALENKTTAVKNTRNEKSGSVRRAVPRGI